MRTGIAVCPGHGVGQYAVKRYRDRIAGLNMYVAYGINGGSGVGHRYVQAARFVHVGIVGESRERYVEISAARVGDRVDIEANGHVA